MSIDFSQMDFGDWRFGGTGDQNDPAVRDFWTGVQAAQPRVGNFVTPSTSTVTPEQNTGASEFDLQRQADDAAMARQIQQQGFESRMLAAQEQKRQDNAIATMRALLTDYGLSALYDRVVGFIKDGYDDSAVMVLIRTTPEYKQRFPAMEALGRKGRAISEGEYIDYERTASGLERRYGFPDGMLMGSITDLLTNEVSLTELNDRVLLASSAAIQAPDDVKNTFMDYYGIGPGGLAAYFLDPAKATPLLEKQFATGVIGTEARRQGVEMDVYGSENLASLGISQDQAREGFGRVAGARGLTQGRGDVVSQQQLVSGTFEQNEESLKAIERAQKARTGRFQEGGGFTSSAQGVTGLGSAATR